MAGIYGVDARQMMNSHYAGGKKGGNFKKDIDDERLNTEGGMS